MLQLAASTLNDRGKGRHASRREASAKRQLLTPDQEQTLVDWVKHQGSMGLPFSKKELEAWASKLAGRQVGVSWYKNFMKRHRDDISAAKGVWLDPKRASNFNKTVINDYFDRLEALHGCFSGGIPAEHIWNMDEKGIQLGGGRKNMGTTYFYSRSQKHKSHLKSDNLELVTVLECVSAAGDIVPPSFCLQSGSAPDLRSLHDDQWGRYLRTLQYLFSGPEITEAINVVFIFRILDGQTHTIASAGYEKFSFHSQNTVVLIIQSQ